VTLPQAIFGSYHIFVRTDIYNQVFEHAFESNNTGMSDSFNIILTPPPDLQVTVLSIPAAASNNESMTVQWSVQNLGGSATTGYWNDRIYITTNGNYDFSGATLLKTLGHHGALNPGDSYSTQASVSISQNFNGPYFIYVQTDASNHVFEFSNENNNSLRSDTTLVVSSPDLVITSLTLPAGGTSGQDVTVQWNIGNNGPGDLLNANWNDRILLSTHPVYHPDSVNSLGSLGSSGSIPASSSIAKQKTVTLPNGISGTHYIFVETDFGGSVFENGLDGNNVSAADTLPVALAPWPDLQVSSVSGADTATAGDTVGVSFTVANYGAAAAQGSSWNDAVYLSTDTIWGNDDLLAQVQHSQVVAVGDSYSVSLSVVLAATLNGGDYYFFVKTDRNNAIYEHTDENNNVSRSEALYLHDYPPIDLEIIAYSAPDSASSGNSVTVQWTVQNNGIATTLAGNWTDAIYLSNDTLFDGGDQQLGAWPQNGQLTPGSSYSNSQSVTIPNGQSGDFYLLAVADHADANQDDDFSNNVRWQALHITLTPSPDLMITNLQVPQQGTAGQPFDISWTVQNNGAGPTVNGSWTERFYLSTDYVIDGGDQLLGSFTRSGNLGTGQFYTDTTQVTIPITASGNRIVIMATDYNDVEYEHNAEGNNTATAVMSITQPPPSDLVVASITVPDSAIAGDNLTLEWAIGNQGQNPAAGVMKDAVFLSKDTVWDINDVLFGTLNSNINIAPQSQVTRSLTANLTGVSVDSYYVIVQTDILNNILESNDTNNTLASTATMDVNVQELQLNVLTANTLHDNVELFYRLEVPDTLEDETIIVMLKGDSVNGANEFYARYGEMPTRVTYDFSHSQPFQGNQEVVIPTAKVGTYYFLVYGSVNPGASQNVTLFATTLDFEVRSVHVNQGGNTGSVTVRIEGSKFEPTMEVRLEGSGLDTIIANSVSYIDPTLIFATFNLSGAPVGFYDLTLEKQDSSTATMMAGFEVVTGSGGGTGGGGTIGNTQPGCNPVSGFVITQILQTNIQHPASTRPNRIIAMTIHYANSGNIDIPVPTRFLVSLEGAPVGYNVPDLGNEKEELFMEFAELNGPQNVLRAGATGTITVYAKASANLQFKLLE